LPIQLGFRDVANFNKSLFTKIILPTLIRAEYSCGGTSQSDWCSYQAVNAVSCVVLHHLMLRQCIVQGNGNCYYWPKTRRGRRRRSKEKINGKRRCG